jgi:hypothetical protein
VSSIQEEMNGNVSLACLASGDPEPEVWWQLNGGPLNGTRRGLDEVGPPGRSQPPRSGPSGSSRHPIPGKGSARHPAPDDLRAPLKRASSPWPETEIDEAPLKCESCQDSRFFDYFPSRSSFLFKYLAQHLASSKSNLTFLGVHDCKFIVNFRAPSWGSPLQSFPVFFSADNCLKALLR